VRDFLKNNGFTVSSAGLKFLPNQKTEVSDLETAKKVIAFMEAIEEDDDVSEVHTNADIPESIAAQL
jgi:transcriptional/translational regulatory protein YebC/TACO1